MDMRGLANFIQDIRKATSNRDEEQKRIDVELSKIRSKFRETGKLSAYDRKKYVCKLMFIAMLGYAVDFGHMEGVQLLSGDTNSEKLIGYLSISVFLNENHELLTLTTHTVHLDLLSGKEFNTCLALTAIGNTGGKDFAEAMSHGVEKLILAKVSPIVKKKALLAMLRLYRKYKDVVDLQRIVPSAVDLISDTNMGVANCAVSFVQGVLDSSTEVEAQLKQVVPNCVTVLERIIMHKATEVDYIYYSVPAPWLQAKLLRLLQYFPRPDSHLLERMTKVLEKIQSATERVLADAQTHQRQRGTQNRCNAMNAVLVEVVSLAILWDCRGLLDPCQKILKTFVKDRKDANLRYLGMDLTMRLSFCQGSESRFYTHVEELQQEVFLALEDPDISIRKKALALLYCACTQQSAREVMDKCIEYIPHSDQAFRHELVRVVALLAEKYCTDNGWYCETILQLLQHAGQTVPSDIWFRLIHVAVGSPPIQKRMTEAAFAAMLTKSAPEVVVNVAAFLLGEFGYTIAVNSGSEPMSQVVALNSYLQTVSAPTKCIILSSLCKMYNLYAVGNVRDSIIRIFEHHQRNIVPEIQQRATEYLTLVTTLSDEALQLVLEPLPPFEREIPILLVLAESHCGTDRDIWGEMSRSRDEKQMRVARSMRDAGLATSHVKNQQDQVPTADEPPKQAIDALLGKLLTQQSNSTATVDAESSRAYFDALVTVDAKGPLYSSGVVRISLAQEYRGADGRVNITVDNVSGSDIQDLTLTIVSSPPNLVLQHKPIPTGIPAGGSVSILFACRCLGGYSDFPVIALGWKGCAPVRCKLPIAVHKFISAYPVSSIPAFDSLWTKTATGNIDISSTPQRLGTSDLGKVSKFLTGIGFWVNESGNQLVAAGSFASMPSTAQFYPVLIKMSLSEEGHLVYALIRSPTPELQVSILSLLHQML